MGEHRDCRRGQVRDDQPRSDRGGLRRGSHARRRRSMKADGVSAQAPTHALHATVTVTATTIALGIWCVFTTRFLEVVILLMTPSLVGTITALTRTCKNEHSAFLRISGR